MGVLGDPVSSGVRAGVERAGRFGLRIDGAEELLYADGDERYPPELQLPIEFTRGLLLREDASLRFCELFAEMVTVAAIARHHYGDPALTESDLEKYVQHSYGIFNSFRHA